MSYEIKITCTAETPITSKFAQFEALARNAQDYLSDIKSECEPIIHQVGKAKYEAIMAQIAPIAQSAQKLCVLRNENITLYGIGTVANLQVIVCKDYYRVQFIPKGSCISNAYPFDFDINEKALCYKNGLLTHWSEYDIIEQLEKSLTDKYNEHINSLKSQAAEVKQWKSDMLK